MFCVNCGTPLREGQNFCEGCGKAVPRAAAAATPPPPRAAKASARCQWCGADADAADAACPRCGAALARPPAATESGWTELPARKDMAKLQFGNSSCQIEGLYVPVADMNLAAGDSVYFTHHVLLWKEPQVNISVMSLKGAWKRMFAGLPLIMTQAEGPGRIAFSKDDPGELIPVALQPGQSIDVREHMLLAATSNVAYDWFQTNIWFETKEDKNTETHYPVGRFMDRFTASHTPGLLLLHAGGNIFVRNLAPGQTILVKPSALVFKDPAVEMQLHFEQPGAIYATWRPWGNRYLWLRLSGPGRVAIQSVFERIEGESRNMTRWSNATVTRW
ncbi:MAG TPA: AIM24 family protein [Bryobacteraceae bacterium]|nr:AIM24 family protein [Bryobacteraceae bacterium]